MTPNYITKCLFGHEYVITDAFLFKCGGWFRFQVRAISDFPSSTPLLHFFFWHRLLYSHIHLTRPKRYCYGVLSLTVPFLPTWADHWYSRPGQRWPIRQITFSATFTSRCLGSLCREFSGDRTHSWSNHPLPAGLLPTYQFLNFYYLKIIYRHLFS